MDHITDNEELKSDAPVLAGLPKADPFVVPEGFFDRFPHQVQASITAQQPAPDLAWPWWKRWVAALPVVLLAAVGIWMATRSNGPVETPAVAITPLTDGELDAIDDTEILAAFDDSDAGEIPAEGLGEVALQLEEDELLAYLEHEDADMTDLITDIE